MKITVVLDNHAREGFLSEHGLALFLETDTGKNMLFDTGAGNALLPNLNKLEILPESIENIFLSHGHGDHTGGLSQLIDTQRNKKIFYAPGITKGHYSLHPGEPVHDISMPKECVRTLRITQSIEIKEFTEILPGFFATGPIPRISGEDCGGPFYLEQKCRRPDIIDDEQALLTASGILIQGCCHAGIVNTLAYCRTRKPDIPIRIIIGGLHLVHADESRLLRTEKALKEYAVKKLYLLHCTGDTASEHLREHLVSEISVTTLRAGDAITLS